MKPRLRFIDGLWMCGAWPFWPPYTLGVGYTPDEAYADWKTQSVSGCALSAAQS